MLLLDKPGFNYVNWILIASLVLGLVVAIIIVCIKDAKQKVTEAIANDFSFRLNLFLETKKEIENGWPGQL